MNKDITYILNYLSIENEFVHDKIYFNNKNMYLIIYSSLNLIDLAKEYDRRGQYTLELCSYEGNSISLIQMLERVYE